LIAPPSARRLASAIALALMLAALVVGPWFIGRTRLLASMWLGDVSSRTPLLLCALSAAVLLATSREWFCRTLPLLLLAGWLSLSAWLIPSRVLGASPWIVLIPYFSGLAVVTLLQAIPPTPSEIRRINILIAAVVVASVLLDAEGLWPWAVGRRPGGCLANRNFAGQMAALTLPSCLIAVANARRRIALALPAAIGLALAWTRCRGAWIAAAIAAGLVSSLVRPGDRRRIAWAVAAACLGALAAGIMPSRLSWQQAAPYRASLSRIFDFQTGSGRFRLEQHIETLKLLKEHALLGLGPGNWQPAMQSVRPALALNHTPHSEYLRALADGGVPALILLVLWMGSLAWLAWKARDNAPDALPVYAALAIISLGDAPLYRPDVVVLACLWWSAVGSAASSIRRMASTNVEMATISNNAPMGTRAMPRPGSPP
jgi:O-antigen ligase